MNAIPKQKSRLTTACAALFALWCASLVVAAVAVMKTSEAQASSQATLKLSDSLAPDLASVRTYNSALLLIADSLGSNKDPKTFTQFLTAHFPRSQATSFDERAEMLGTSGLKMTSVTAKWISIPFSELSQIIAKAESAAPPFRLNAITLTPSRKKDMVQAEASFISFIK